MTHRANGICSRNRHSSESSWKYRSPSLCANNGIPYSYRFPVSIFLNKKSGFPLFFIFISVRRARLALLFTHLSTTRKLSLEELNGDRDFVAHATTHAKVMVAGLNHLLRCLVIPRRALVEQLAELLHHISQLLFGKGQPLLRVRVSTRFLAVHGVVQVGLLVKVQHDTLALEQACRAVRYVKAHEAERLAERLVGARLRGLGGLDSLHATTFLLFADFPLYIFSFNFFK